MDDPTVEPADEPRPDAGGVAALGFDAWYAAQYPAVVRLAWVLTGRRDVAEELAQDAFVAAHRRWAQLSAYDDPAAWVRRVALNRAVSALRRRAVEAKGLGRLAGRGRASSEPPALPDAEVWAAVRALPRRQAEVIALAVVEDLPVEEVAAVLGCGPETVRTHLRRARLALATALGAVEGQGR